MCYSGTCIYENHCGDCTRTDFFHDYANAILGQSLCAIGGFKQDEATLTPEERDEFQKKIRDLNTKLFKYNSTDEELQELQELKLKIETIKMLKKG